MKILILHGDLDGLSSGAVLYNMLFNAEGKKPLVLVSQPFYLHKILEKILYRKDISEIFLMDISVDTFSWYKTKAYLSELAKRAGILWIDHHRSTLYKIRELVDIGVKVFYENNGCTATLVKRLYVDKTDNVKFFERITIIGEIGDKVLSTLSKGSKLLRIAEILGSVLALKTCDDEFKINLVKKWALEKKYIDRDVMEEAIEATKKFRNFLNMAENRVIFSSEKIMVIDFSGIGLKGFTGKIAMNLSNKYGKIVIIIFTPNEREVVFTCRVPKTYEHVNIEEILRVVAKKVDGGSGGHKKAASLRLLAVKRRYALNLLLSLLNSHL